jgi:hypothetical protein
MKAGQWLELTMTDRAIVLDQVAEQQQVTGRPATALDWNMRMQEVLERTAEYDMSLMPTEQNAAYQKRLIENRIRLQKEKAAECENTATA